MTKKRITPILPGGGPDDYARYMRTDALLSLQKAPSEMRHRDELLFQTVHQCTELWLKHACFELSAATEHVRRNGIDSAVRLLRRAQLAAEFLTDQLEMLKQMTPWDFQQVRGALGNGSGLESAGWREVRRVTPMLGTAFEKLRVEHGVDLADLYQRGYQEPLYPLAEALIDWDEAISTWRVRHYMIAARINGEHASGTHGNPVDMLNRLIHHKFFPELWQVRDQITALGKRFAAEDQVISRDA